MGSEYFRMGALFWSFLKVRGADLEARNRNIVVFHKGPFMKQG